MRLIDRWLGKYSELFDAVMRVAVGLWTGYAAFISSGTMAVAYFMTAMPRGFWPIVNRGELAVLYCFVFLSFSPRSGQGR